MKVAIIGSRILNIDISRYIPYEITEIISGGAKGIDAQAELYADKNYIPKQIFKPEYNIYGKAAPLQRNKKIVEVSDMVIALWDGKSHGTKYVIDYAKKIKKPLEVYIISRN